MPIPAANFDRKIEIWRNTLAAANGLGERLPTPVKVASPWASVDAKAAFERTGTVRTEAVTTKLFTVRYALSSAQIDPAHYFIRYQGRDYNIRSVTEVGFREAFDIVADARADTAPVG